MESLTRSAGPVVRGSRRLPWGIAMVAALAIVLVYGASGSVVRAAPPAVTAGAGITVNARVGNVALGMKGIAAVKQALGAGSVASAAGDEVSRKLTSGGVIVRLYQDKVVEIETTSPSFSASGVHVGSSAGAARTALGGGVQSTGNSLYVVGHSTLQGNKVHTYFDLSADGSKVTSIRMGYFPWLTSCYGGPTQIMGSQLPSGKLSHSQTWGLRGCPYVITGDVEIPQGVSLTFAPGVIVKFTDSNSDLYVHGGIMQAHGTADSPVVFTSLNDQLHGAIGTGQYPTPKPGAWYGLGIWAEGGTLTLDHAAVYYAGANQSYGAVFVQGQGAPTLTVQDSLLGYNATVAINATNAEASATIKRNVFFGNDVPLWINGGISIDGSNVFAPAGLSPNKQNGIYLTPNAAIGNVSGAVTWGAQHAPFVVNGDSHIPQGSTLTIKPGVTVKFVNASSDLYVHGGGLVARGTASAPIVFTSIDDHLHANLATTQQVPAQPGQWYGLGIWAEGGTLTLDHAAVYYAGANQSYGAVFVLGQASATLTVQNSVFAYNANTALDLRQAPPSTTFQHNTFFGNDIPLAVNGGLTVDASNVFHGARPNKQNAIFLTTNGSTSAGTTTLSETEIPFVIANQFAVRSGATLVLNAGVVLKGFDASAQIYINGGTLTVNGTASQPVVMTALTDSAHGTYSTGNGVIAGDWRGVYIDGAAHVNATHLQVFYAGADGGIYVGDPAVLTLTNSEVAKGAGDGLVYNSSRPLTLTNSSIHDNKGFGINFASKVIQSNATMGGTTVENNTKGNLAVGGQVVTTS